MRTYETDTRTTTDSVLLIYRCRKCERLARDFSGNRRLMIAKRIRADRVVNRTTTHGITGVKTAVRVRYLHNGKESLYVPDVRCEAGHPMFPEQVYGTKNTEVKCGAKCRAATGPNCECSCGGANHGAGYDSEEIAA